MAELTADGREVRAGDVVVRAPGLRGTVVAAPPGTGDVRAESVVTPIDSALNRPDFVHLQHIVIDATVEPETLQAGVRGGVTHPGVVEIEVPAPTDGWGQFAVASDPVTGVVSWSFGAGDDEPVVSTRSEAGRRRYAIPVTATDATPSAEQVRGGLGAVFKKVIKVVAFKLIKRASGDVAEFFAERWERHSHPHALWVLPDDDIRPAPPQDPPTAADWAMLAGGPALLLVHGTFSSARNGFGSLDTATVATLRGRYGNRVFAFDHPTLSVDPVANAAWMLGQIPDGVHLDVDIVCHSRGGLVSRVLAEGYPGAALDRSRLGVDKTVFVGTPHAGTPLANADGMEAFLDTYTNLLTVFPDNGVIDGIDAILEVVKDVAAGALAGLPGLQSMKPGGPFLAGLNGAAGWELSKYHAIAADYEPVAPSSLAAKTVDLIADAAFAAATHSPVDNDLVVPTAGGYAVPAAGFAIANPLLIPPADGIHHCRYFGADQVRSQLLGWLPG